MVDTIWLEAQRRLRAELSEKDFEAWVAPLRATEWADGLLTIEVPSAFSRDWLRRHFAARLEEAIGAAAGRSASILLVVNRALDAPVPIEPIRPRPLPARAAHVVRTNGAPARYTFDNFVVGASNQVAFGAAQAVVSQPGARFNPLFIHGGCGLGKTHLLSAVAHATGARSATVAFVSAENFVNEMIAALKSDRMSQFRQRFRRIETLIVDDVQFLGGKRRSQEEFIHTFNALHDGRKQIVLASDRAPADMPGIDDTLRNRFASGLLADVQPPDPALRLALVRRKADALGMTLPADVIQHLADRWCSNGRELEGVLQRLDAFVELSGQPLTLALARHALAGQGRANGGRPSVARIVGEVCRHYRLSHEELVSQRRTARVALPRQVAMYLCRQHTDVPLGAIGADLGGRDHSTVKHALGKIERQLQEDAALREVVAALRAKISA